jgi:hypothetical protein
MALPCCIIAKVHNSDVVAVGIGIDEETPHARCYTTDI